MMPPLSRRSLFRLAGLGAAAGTTALGTARLRGQAAVTHDPATHSMATHAAHVMGPVGRVSTTSFDPGVFTRSWNFSHLPPEEREGFYRETRRPDGTLLREYQLIAADREIEIAPGIFFPAWTFNGQVPGPTLRATEGDRVKVTFVNNGSHPHTMHFHGIHRSSHDGVTGIGRGEIDPGSVFVYD